MVAGVDWCKYSIMMRSDSWRLVRRVVALMAVVMLIPACQSEGSGTPTTQDCPSPISCGAGYDVAATSIDPNNTYGYNLVVDASLTQGDLRGIAEEVRAFVGEGRFILFFFTSDSGEEVHGFGLMPTDDQVAAPEPLNTDHFVGMVDLRHSGEIIEGWYDPAA
jgi:hypothetical protein